MMLNVEIRHAIDPKTARVFDTKALRENFHVGSIFQEGEINLIYTHYDRMIVGGVVPAGKRLELRHVKEGKIINLASMLTFQGDIRVPSYTASKSGVAGLTKLLANEWAARGISVNAIAPGYIATNNTEALRADESRNKSILERIPAGRWGEPDDIGGAAVFLATPAAKYVHGAIVNVDGGWLAR
jgi:NAD(P)-dependent dehydrogenase (short-subunit alcohol dehydrogenase family)